MIEVACDPIWSWASLLVGRFLLQFWCPCLWLVCLDFLFLPGSVLEGHSSKNLSISSKLPLFWHIVAHSSLLWSFVFVLSVVISPFSFLTLLIWFFSFFFLMSLANSLSILFIFSKSQLLVLLIFAIVSFVSFSFTSTLIFMISFLLLTLGFFFSSFSSCFRCKVQLLFWCFSCFLR